MRKKKILGTSDLVDDSFVPSAKQTSVLYCRLTSFKQASQQAELSGRKKQWKIVSVSYIVISLRTIHLKRSPFGGGLGGQKHFEGTSLKIILFVRSGVINLKFFVKSRVFYVFFVCLVLFGVANKTVDLFCLVQAKQ